MRKEKWFDSKFITKTKFYIKKPRTVEFLPSSFYNVTEDLQLEAKL